MVDVPSYNQAVSEEGKKEVLGICISFDYGAFCMSAGTMLPASSKIRLPNTVQHSVPYRIFTQN